MKNLRFILFCLFALSLGTLQAQVTIGSLKAPEDFSALEIISNGTGGMRLPQLSTEERDELQDTQAFKDEIILKGRGLTIYNTDIECVEYWNGKRWISRCEDSVPESCLEPCDCDGDGFIDCACNGNAADCDPDDNDPCNPAVTGISYSLSPASGIEVGTPVLITLSAATGIINNVSIDGGITRVRGKSIQVTPPRVGENTFTIMVNNCPSQIVTVGISTIKCSPITSASVTACTNYMFTYQTMKLSASKTGGSTASYYQWYLDGKAVRGATNSTFDYSPNDNVLETDALGNYTKTVSIYCEVGNACGTVKTGNYDVQVVQAQYGILSPIYVNAVDETGAALAPQKMAHVNVGAQWDLDPCDMLGEMFQWGRVADGHQKRNPTDEDVWPNGVAVPGSDPATVFDANGQVPFGDVRYGKIIKSAIDELDSRYDWRVPKDDMLWGDPGGGLRITPKSVNDPCPNGWKVPTQKQLSSIYNGGSTVIANPWVWQTDWKYAGYLVNGILYLPAGGRLQTEAQLGFIGTDGGYWTTSPTDRSADALWFTSSSINMKNVSNRKALASLRCVEDLMVKPVVPIFTPSYNTYAIATGADTPLFTGAVFANGTGDAKTRGTGVRYTNVAAGVFRYTDAVGENLTKQTITHASGLEVTIPATTLANGAGELQIFVSGTPNASWAGKAFDIPLTIFGQTLYVRVNTGCGAYTDDKTIPSLQEDPAWLQFQCFNLGAENTLNNPFQYIVGNEDGSGGTLGSLFEWGREADGHEKRNSTIIFIPATDIKPKHPDFIHALNDWLDGGGNNDRWGDGTDNLNQARGVNDPCPTGWKVPSQAQLNAILKTGTGVINDETVLASGTGLANKWVWSTGFMVGDALYLPAGGTRYYDNGMSNSVNKVGNTGAYWTSTAMDNFGSRRMYLDRGEADPGNDIYGNKRTHGFSLRCVAD